VLPLKNDHCYAILDDLGMTAPGAVRQAGIYLHDTRHLSVWRWDFGDLELIHSEAAGRTLTQYWSRMTRHAQKLLLVRRLELSPIGISEELRLENSTGEPAEIRIGLAWDADFTDIFEARGHKRQAPRNPVERLAASASYRALDGIDCRTTLDLGRLPLDAPLTVPPHETLAFVVTATFRTTLPAADSPPPDTPPWTPRIDMAGLTGGAAPLVAQAAADIETLQLSTPHGRTIAAGIPNFVVPFGRDSIITAWLLLGADPTLARSVLTHLAAHQGKAEDSFRDEEPGKIMHEHREGELSRIGELPFRTYYGSADSTPLFLVLLADYVAATGDTAPARTLEPNWRAAMRWIESYADEHGLIRFKRRGDGKGLTVQSWKDSADSMSYGDGRPGEGNLAVAEVQGYVFAALHAACALSELCGGPDDERAGWRAEAETLAKRVDELFWMPEHRNYALALDGSGRQLDVNASDTGHLLWSGIVPQDKAPTVIARLFGDDLWSGYGLRTLSTREKRYNPLSYHNGSVWPHDTAIFAAGLRRYGDEAGFAKVREALIALAGRSADRRLPELVGGYARDGDTPPLPYVESCRPQAWAAAALIYVCGTKTAQVGVPTGIGGSGASSPAE
jgi:glycogen debranching enzyme